ncbi:MAG: protein kinase [Leptolyngbya sp.]|nr:protein kinase [Candidatus Melainabacteria bacterium]
MEPDENAENSSEPLGASEGVQPLNDPDPENAGTVTMNRLGENMRSSDQPLNVVADSLVGEILDGKYGIVKRLGVGGMSVVYQARDLSLGRNVAIKMMPLQSGHTMQDMLRFQQEAKTISRLHHPNLVTVFDFSTQTMPPYLVMEYIEGSSLAEVISDDGALSLLRGIKALRQICSALKHAHENGVVHRDLKPANILMEQTKDHEEIVKIVDFGIAKILQADNADVLDFTQSGEILGSPLYMSPEQCQGKKLDHRADIYSLGCVMYAIFVGSPPFQGPTAFETIQKHMHEQPVSISSRRKDLAHAIELDSVLFKAMAKEPEQRYQTAEEFDEALAKIGLTDGSAGFGTLKAMINLNFSRAAAKKSRGMPASTFWLMFLVSMTIGGASLWHALDTHNSEESVKRWPEINYDGQRAFDTGDYPRAEMLLTWGLKQAQRSGSQPRIAASLKELIDLSSVLGDQAKVTEYSSQLSSSPEDTKIALRTYRIVAVAQSDLAEVQKALKTLPKGADGEARRLKLQRKIAVIIGDCRQLLVRKQEAHLFTVITGPNAMRCLEILRETRTVCKQLTGEKHPLYGRLLHTLALAYLATSQPDLAEKCFESAEELLKTSTSVPPLERAEYLSDAAHFFQMHGNVEKAVQALEKELELAGGPESNSVTAGAICFQLAELYNSMHESEKANHYAQLAQDILEKTQDNNLNTLRAFLLLYKRDFSQCLAQADQSLRENEKKEVKDYWTLSALLSIIASCYAHDKVSVEKAIPLLKRAIAINERGDEPFAQMRRLQKLAEAYALCGKNDQRLTAYLSAQKIAERLYGSSSPALAELLKDIGDAQLDAGNREQAENYLRKAVVILKEGSANPYLYKQCLLKLAGVLSLTGRLAESDELKTRASTVSK